MSNQGQHFKTKAKQFLHSDSSNKGWAGLDLSTGQFIHDFWRKENSLHINVKELKAALATLQSLAHPNTSVMLSVDNQVTFYYLKKAGGKKPEYNKLLRPFLRWCRTNRIHLSIQCVPSAQMQADSISRWNYDKGDYTLNHQLTSWLFQQLSPWITPKVDCFASPGNRKLPQFIARYPHHQALLTDALQCPLETLTEIYANPPWTVIQPWLVRLRDNKQLTCVLICPFWVSTRWWPLLTKLHVPHTPTFLIKPFRGMFLNCHNEEMPPPGGH